MQQIKNLFGEIPVKKSGTERGELLKHFASKLHLTIPRVAFHLTGMDVQTLYYIKSLADSEERRGVPWGKTFWSSIKIKV